ncbi:MAG: YbaK/EbsC family protein [Ignavibacteriales bacterium]|nr:YbaK/EbsC family protein [Ignavibacteriales bacterium]
MPAKKLKEFLDKNKIKYVSIKHSPAFTAQEIAESAHITGKCFAKTVIVKIDGKMAMAVLPAKYLVDIDLLKETTGAEFADLATEQEFEDQFPGCEVGAMPPFGNLYGMDVFVAETLTKDEEIAFSAGTHTEVIKLPFKDFERLVKPKVISFSLK